MTTFVSLFRAINVGGNRKVEMDELKAVHEALGLRKVLSYIQSGNVVFTSDDADPIQIQRQIEESFEQQFGFRADVIIRTADELRTIIERNPFQGQQDKEPKWVAVMFLATQPDSEAQETILKTYVGPEEMFFNGKELYLYYPDGMGRSKLTNNYLEKKLKTVGTARNWNTVLRLQEMMRGVIL